VTVSLDALDDATFGSINDVGFSAGRATWTGRRDRYSEIRASQTSARRRIEMSYIGG